MKILICELLLLLLSIWEKLRKESPAFALCEDENPSGPHENEDVEEARIFVEQESTRSPISIVPEVLAIPDRRIYWQDPFEANAL